MTEVNASVVSWTGAESIQWGCALMELLGESSLEHLPLLMSGTRAVESSYQTRKHLIAIRNARQKMGRLLTRRAIQKAIRDLAAQAKENGTDPSYTIHPTNLSFRRMQGHGMRISAAMHLLQQEPKRPEHKKRLAPAGDLVARFRSKTDNAEVSIPIRLLGLEAPPPAQHSLDRKPAAELVVTLDDLKKTALELDQMDQEHGWKPEDWMGRLNKVIRLLQVTDTGLQETETLDLKGLQHLIGLPGAGKTTLITLLCAFLADQKMKVAVFFTSIETAREYLSKLRRYGKSSALLVGRSSSTHQRHGERLAELIATQGSQGFAHTTEGADLFAQTCPLPAFATNEVEAWAHWGTNAPCDSIYQPRKDVPHLCPLWSRCGRVKNQRDLVEANIWLGHIRSADTPVPAHTSREHLQYFELIAETFDLVIFDEVDEAQNVLDDMGAITLSLGGTPDSIRNRAQDVTGLGLVGGLPPGIRKKLYPHHYAANNFELHLIRLHQEIDTFEQDYQDEFGIALENRLLTTSYLIRQAITYVNVTMDGPQRGALYSFWDSAIYTAFFRDRRPGHQGKQYAEALGMDEDEADDLWKELVSALEDYLYELTRVPDLTEELEKITTLFARLIAKDRKEDLAPFARLSVAVGFAVAAYQELARMTRPLADHNILPDVIKTNASKTLQQFVARSLMGTFSSVRYRIKENRQGYEIDYLVLDCTPRLLLQHMHEMGANVLLTSATSWMPDSTAYHVNVDPTYVLSPKDSSTSLISLHFTPIKHPSRNEYLKFSGAGRHRLENLKLMVSHLAKPTINNLSMLDRAVRSMRSPEGRPRKCALVVNSYEQVVEVIRQIARLNPSLAERCRGVVRQIPEAVFNSEHYVLRGQVETLGHQDDVDVIVFPLTALGRGVNIVFNTDDKDHGTAAIGSLYFLTRPHPVVSDLTLMLSTIARATEQFDLTAFPNSNLEEISQAYLEARKALYVRTMRLLSRPLSASKLPEDFFRPFSANLLIPILQTIGRAIRRSMPAEIYFVDAAWAPRSANEEADDPKTSVLVTMRDLLQGYVSTGTPKERAILRALYLPFADAFNDIEKLVTGALPDPDTDEDDEFFPGSLEDLGDLD